MSKCFDHRRSFPDSHSKVLPDNSIYRTKSIVLGRLQPQRAAFDKNKIGFAAYVLLLGQLYFIHQTNMNLIYIYIFIHIYI